MADRILIINGHPDPDPAHFCTALAEAYAEGAAGAGRALRRIDVAALEFPILRRKAEFETGTPPPPIAAAQADIEWADHLVLIYPLWMGTMPALFKAFIEQVFRPGFAMDQQRTRPWSTKLAGRSARIVITMGMPAAAYRWFFGAHSLRSLERNILKFCGIKPVRAFLAGSIDDSGGDRHERYLAQMRALGASGR